MGRIILAALLSLWVAVAGAQTGGGIYNPGMVGPSSATSGDVALFSGTSGQILSDGGAAVGRIGGINVTASTVPVNGAYLPAANTIGFATNTTAAAAIDASQNLTVGSVTQVPLGATSAAKSRLQTQNISGAQFAATFAHFQANSNGPNVFGAKSRAAVLGTNTIVLADDNLLTLAGSAADGTNYITAAQIGFQVDGTPGANDMPGRLVFSTTADGAASLTEALRINALQQLVLTAITTDATHVTASLCVDTTSKAVFFGSAALGVCLGTSSARFKNINGKVKDGLAEIMRLETVDYRYKPGTGMDPDHDLYGFTAEQVYTVMPKLVGLGKDGEINTIDMVGMIPVLVNAIKEQQAQIEALKAR